MSDFLRNLRSSHKKEASHTRKSLDGHYYPQNDRRIIKDRRSGYSGGGMDTFTQKISDMLPEILEHVAILTEQVEKQTKTNELLVEARIRQSNAVAEFFEAFNKQILNDNGSNGPVDIPPPKATTSYASGTHYTKDDILDMIRNMRDQGTTFAIIAEYLKEKGIPTFSGRGEWHAQTIHRLCK